MSATRILGIDPGSVITGYGVIECEGLKSKRIAHGHIRVVADTQPEKLGIIFDEITQVIAQWQPQEVAIEQVFVSNNPQTAIKLGQARGAAICAAVQQALPVSEYTPSQIKQAVVGHGRATKEQVQHMINVLLNIGDTLQADAADGLAIAVCHSHNRNSPAVALGLKTRSRRSRKARWR